jgi:hypothetical protein
MLLSPYTSSRRVEMPSYLEIALPGDLLDHLPSQQIYSSYLTTSP